MIISCIVMRGPKWRDNVRKAIAYAEIEYGKPLRIVEIDRRVDVPSCRVRGLKGPFIEVVAKV